jgi:preprotein translocase subunit SecD
MINVPRWKIILVTVLSLSGLLYALPNLLPAETRNWLQTHMPAFVPQQSVSLGLDLRGGSHLLLEVDLDAVVNDYLAALLDEARVALRKEQIAFTEATQKQDGIQLRVSDLAQIDAAVALLRFEQGLDVRTDDHLISITPSAETLRQRRSAALEQSLEIVRRRIDATGTKEPSIQRQGENRILVQLPGVDDPQRIKQLLGTTAKMTFRLVDEAGTNELGANPAANAPPGSEKLPTNEKGLPFIAVQRRVMVSGETLIDSQATFDQFNKPSVSFKFDATGARKFSDATKGNVGKLFAIVLDGKVISFPRINEPILGGSGIITGNFTVEEAKDLSLLLRAGALPAPIKVLEERTVGPGLGADSIRAGAVAALVGCALVVAFMILSYGLFGIFGAVALVINIAMIFAILSVLQATLTLPGIAGIVLTIGTAVDANVLIFERVREEIRLGRTPIAALDTGYTRALSAIIDANVTTLISALLLMMFGTGPIKGFGVTLTIGTVTSVFSAVWITRLMVIYWLKHTKPKMIPI